MASLSVLGHPCTPGLKLIYERFCSFGKGHKIDLDNIKMESRSFLKFCKDTLLINKKLSNTSCDLIFTRVKKKGTRTIDFIGFLSCLEQAATVRGVTYDRFTNHVLKFHGLQPDGQRATPTTTPTRISNFSSSLKSPTSFEGEYYQTSPAESFSSPSTATTSKASRGAFNVMPSTMLIVVDMQLDFYSRNAVVSKSFPELPTRISNLITACRNSGLVEVVHLREGSNSNDSPWYNFWQQLNPGCDSSADPTLPEPCAREKNNEKVFIKYGYDGVGVNSGLVDYVNSRSRQNGQPMNILMCGLVTSCCVHMNAAGLFLRGYPTFVVSDACGDRTERMHLESLRRESRRSYAVIDINNVITLLDAEVTDGKAFADSLVSVCWPNKTQIEK